MCHLSCADGHRVYTSAGWLGQQVANFGGSQDASQANVTTSFAYDGDGRVLDSYVPITGANPSTLTGQIDDRKIYDVLGRLVSEIKATAIPGWMPATTSAETDYTLDAGGRLTSVTGPGTGSTTQTNRIMTSTTYDDLNRPLTVAVDPSGLDAITTTVYDPTGAVHVWSPATQLDFGRPGDDHQPQPGRPGRLGRQGRRRWRTEADHFDHVRRLWAADRRHRPPRDRQQHRL